MISRGFAGLLRARFALRWVALAAAFGTSLPGQHAAASDAARPPEHFHVEGWRVDVDGGVPVPGRMYVELRRPARPLRPYPIVMIHGAAQTGSVWTGTPDGRAGWADWFVEQGYEVYVLDQPGSGRSALPSDPFGPMARLGATRIERLFTAPARSAAWPQARLHTQFPGRGPNAGLRGDPVFDRFHASQVPFVARAELGERLLRAAGSALLDRIGPAILLTHSQSGPHGWVIADARPQRVKALIAVEPTGPPRRNAVFRSDPARAWGLTETLLAYEPPAGTAAELAVAVQSVPDAPQLAACVLQAEPARQLVNLRRIPVMIVVAEASYHAVYDHCTARWLTQAGVAADLVRLEAVGIRGNGHMMMIERNNLEIAALIGRWLAANVR